MSQDSNQVGDQAAPSIRQLVSDVAKDAKHLLQTQSELAKVERKQTQQQAATTGGLFAVAAVTGGLGGLFLLVTIAYILVALGLPTWAGFGIVTLTLLLIAAIAGLVGKSKAGEIKPFAATKVEIERTKQALGGGEPGAEVAVAPANLPQQR
jgi:uncharacterized membrane protein YqjE